MQTKTTTRRAVLAGIAAALVTPAVALADPSADAELLALGVELEAFLPPYRAQQAKDALHRAAWEAECLRLGLPRLDYKTVPTEEWRERGEARRRVRTIYSDDKDRDVNEHGESIVWNHLHDRMYSLLDDIMDCQPKTIVGLGVMARAASLDYEADPTSDELTKIMIRRLCEFCGVEPVFENEADEDDGEAVS